MTTLFLVDTTTWWIITFLGWGIVFFALVVLVAVFMLVPKLYAYTVKDRLRRQGKLAPNEQVSDKDLQVSGDVNAAIALSLYMYFNELHDEESNVITIKKIERRYSPWSSKIYGMNNSNFPN